MDKPMISFNKENAVELADVLVKAFNDWQGTKGTPFIEPNLIIHTTTAFIEYLLNAGQCPACRQSFLIKAGGMLIKAGMELGKPTHLQDEPKH